MPSPFPGMDPYLERPSLWPGLHSAIINHLQADLNPRLLPNYIAQIETRVYVMRDEDPARHLFIPDVTVERVPKSKKGRHTSATLDVAEPIEFPWIIDEEIEEARIEITDRRSNRLVTVIEVTSPSNKVRGSEGRTKFLAKRRELMAANVNWLEIDLLREGDRSVVPLLPPSDYWVFLSRAADRPRTRGWPISLRGKLPVIGVPLAEKDPDAALDLGKVLNAVHDQAGYGYLIDYRRPPEPPFTPADARWANRLLRDKGLR